MIVLAEKEKIAEGETIEKLTLSLEGESAL